MAPYSVDRRLFLKSAGALGAVVATGGLAGCGGDEGKFVLGAAFANGTSNVASIAAGIPQRAPLVLFDEATARPVRDEGPKSIAVELWKGETRISTATIARHDAGVPTPFYPLTFTVTDPGDYEVRSKLSEIPVAFRAKARTDLKLVQVGDPIRSVNTPTTATPLGVDPICSRTPDPCPFHDVSFAEHLRAKAPTVLLISAPAFCQTSVCGPVLELLIEESKTLPKLKVVHAEVYIDPQEFVDNKPNPRTTDAVKAYELGWEPSLVVANAAGIVTAKLDFVWDRAELQAALKSALS